MATYTVIADFISGDNFGYQDANEVKDNSIYLMQLLTGSGSGLDIVTSSGQIDVQVPIGIGSTDMPTLNAAKVIFFGDNGSNPTMAANTAGAFAKDVSGTVELFGIDEAGNAPQLTPHDPETGLWHFYSVNVKTGRVLKVDMERLMKRLDEFFGGGYVHEFFEDVEGS